MLRLPTTTRSPELQIDQEGLLASIRDSGVLALSLKQSRDNLLHSIFTPFSGARASANLAPHTLVPCGQCDIEIGPHTFSETKFFEARYAPSSPAEASPALVAAVNAAAATNPTFGNLLRMATLGTATADQMQTLSLFIHSLPQTHPPLSSQDTVADGPAKDFDLVLQIADDYLLTLVVQTSRHTTPQPTILEIQFRDPPPLLRETVLRWTGGEDKMELSRNLIRELKKRPRTYLTRRLPSSPLLTLIQEASEPDYTMQPLKPGGIVHASKTKRRPASRKSKPFDEDGAMFSEPQAKRARPSIVLRCQYCEQSGVPLVLGGRYCRACVDAGKAAVVETTQSTKLPGQHVFSVHT
ncbi:SWR1 complex subunit swc3 [Mycena kentingensis (nom. inval.)]|nr:SWR1 complex subunit swc3 [Mycena kentingensis (nom. inval.)]